MSSIRDSSLAPQGLKKIEWARSFMPVLCDIERSFEKERPFGGLKIAISVHVEAKTACLALSLRRAGAEVYVTGCNPLSTQDDVAAALDELGVPVFAWREATEREYEEHLLSVLSCRPDLIIDDGGDLLELLSGKCSDLGGNLIGGCEETTTGVHRLRAREAAGKLFWPMMAVNDAKCKHYYDNKYGTGQSAWDAFMNTTNLLVAGKTVVVAGYGYCGRGIAMRAKGLGADVVVTEVDPFKALEATMENYRVMSMDAAAPLGDIFMTATGCRDIITGRHFEKMKNNAFLANAGHFDCEIRIPELEALSAEVFDRRNNIKGYRLADGRVLNLIADGRLVNLASGNGHPAEIMDLSFAVQALSLRWLAQNRDGLRPGVVEVPDCVDGEVARIKLSTMGLSLDSLSGEQIEYLSGWDM